MSRPLDTEQLERFVRDGWVLLEAGFAPEAAAWGRAVLWDRIGLSPDDRSSWPAGRVWVQEVLSDEPFLAARNSARVRMAFDQLAGSGRWFTPYDGLGWWPIRFPGTHTLAGELAWHVDGGGWKHHLNSPEQGLLPIFLFSDVEPCGGATLMASGSHQVVASVLADAPSEGLDYDEIAESVYEIQPQFEVAEATGSAGDVYLCHPLLMHRASINLGDQPRFIANPAISLKEPMRVDATATASPTPVEQAIHMAVTI